MTHLVNWPQAYPATQSRALFKQEPSDFKVTEVPLVQPSGEGEHVWLRVEKTGANSNWVAKQLADLAGVKEMDVGMAGLKDRHAITQQWFSVYLPQSDAPDFSQLNNDEFKILKQTKHSKKLRRGDLQGNHFEIVLREVTGEKATLENNLQLIQAQGVPNYFGAQRFGHDGGNIEMGRAMLAREITVKQRSKKSIYLSAVRSFIFNEVLAERVRQGLWPNAMAGDIIEEYPTGPLWGRGRLATTDEALIFEQHIAERYQQLCNGLEHAGLSQERRSLVAKPQEFSWQWLEDKQLRLSFFLQAGYYATSLLQELVTVTEPDRT